MMLRRYREKKNMTQQELANLSGVPQSVISYIESGKTNTPRIDTLITIAKTLDVSIDDLVEDKKIETS